MSSTAPTRVDSIDLLRGLVIVLMALDHARAYFSPLTFDATDLTRVDLPLFFTRWVTHFCAPLFIFLAGTSAWLYRATARLSAAELSHFLWTRGLWLVIVELTVVNWTWTGVPFEFRFVQVIWAIGVSMIVLGLLVRLPLSWTVAFGAVTVLGHNLLDGVSSASLGAWGPLWMLLHERNTVPLGDGPDFFISYPLVPWIGVMALGYAFGSLLQRPDRHALAFRIGLALVAAFVLLRIFQVYGDPKPWAVDPRGPLWTLADFLDTQKYPPSLLFLCMTIGPGLMLMPVLDGLRARWAEPVRVFGRVPFFFYVLHVPLIHVAVVVWSNLEYGSRLNRFSWPRVFPEAYEPSLLRTYVAWAIVVIVLYLPCRWYARYKAEHRGNKWLSYL